MWRDVSFRCVFFLVDTHSWISIRVGPKQRLFFFFFLPEKKRGTYYYQGKGNLVIQACESSGIN
jgi:hypothetical protein